ncbi:hypothetical protein MTP99_016127 [Tenebrio molitor]|uniref:lipase member H-like n=1 Tax=Tenebrio molitor TaxID=7067 RepID=UPI0026F4B009|nr:hypothetical protein MTP99_016127 [Tenebrio molitor]
MDRVVRVCALLVVAVPLTVAIDRIDVTFYLFTESDRNYHRIDHSNADEIAKGHAEIVFLIHGWSENRTAEWYHNLTEAFFARGGKKVIQVDYSSVATQIYPLAVEFSPRVGDIVGDFILNLIRRGVPLERVHVCGHSLGGQIAGFAGQYFYKSTSRRLPRITALDPAGPLFTGRPDDERLDESDAEIVYVIHTDRGKFGYPQACGTVDVFPNDGVAIQPGCPDWARRDIFFCSHHKSYEYYIYALAHPNALLATRCQSYSDFKSDKCRRKIIDIGGDIVDEDRGCYFLTTKAVPPYRLRP